MQKAEAWLHNKNHPGHFPKTSKCFENLVGMIFMFAFPY